jgi:hypothetical protein
MCRNQLQRHWTYRRKFPSDGEQVLTLDRVSLIIELIKVREEKEKVKERITAISNVLAELDKEVRL